jgi:hypothetical protein
MVEGKNAGRVVIVRAAAGLGGGAGVIPPIKPTSSGAAVEPSFARILQELEQLIGVPVCVLFW